jgi:DNA (cytosine-5)-methyltransferase 1
VTVTFAVADLFCGAGGTSTGAKRAIEAMGAKLDLVAVNHWDTAIDSHRRNHPDARHYCVNLDAARPETIVPGGRLDLLLASPECTFFSRARGGKPVHDQSRMSAWHVQRWATTIDVRCILVENVAEFLEWGPLLPSGKPDPAGKRRYFEAWVQALWGLGYAVDWKLLNAADYGGATTRTRLFVQARKDGRPIRWPEPTHSREGGGDLFGGLRKWRAAREVIDLTHHGRSLFARREPLSLKTRLRMARGLRRYGGVLGSLYVRLLDLPEGAEVGKAGTNGHAALPEPFIAVGRQNNVPKGVDEPLGTITTIPGTYLIEPTLVLANREHNVPRPVDGSPTPTITSAGGGGLALVEARAEPFMLGQQSGSAPRPLDRLLPTVAAGGAIALVEPQLVTYHGNDDGAKPLDAPVPTLTTKARLGLMEPFLVPQFGEREGQEPRVAGIDAPLPAVTSHGAGALVEPVVVQMALTHQEGKGVRPAEEPLYTITADSRLGVVEPTLLPATAEDVDPRRLIVVDGVLCVMDIRFRMLTNGELAKAMGFDDDEAVYEFAGTKGQVTKQIGNAVECHTAAALVTAILGG